MRQITTYINENIEDIELDNSIGRQEKNKVQHAIYKYLEKTGRTGKFYSDENWEGVKLVREDITYALDNMKNADHDYEVSIAPDQPDYQTSKDGMSKWKQYKVEIFVKYAEHPFMVGTLCCHAAGTIDDPWKLYDMSCCIG